MDVVRDTLLQQWLFICHCRDAPERRGKVRRFLTCIQVGRFLQATLVTSLIVDFVRGHPAGTETFGMEVLRDSAPSIVGAGGLRLSVVNSDSAFGYSLSGRFDHCYR